MKNIFLSLTLVAHFCYSQNIDSLKAVIKNNPADTTLLSLYQIIIDKTPDLNDVALYGELEYKLAQSKVADASEGKMKNFYRDHVAHALNARGTINYSKENYMECFHNFREAERIYTETGNQHMVISMGNNLGVIYEWFGDIEHAMECYSKAVSEFQRTGDTADLADASYNLGLLYFDKGNFAKTEELCLIALACYKSTKDFEKVAEAQNNLALLKFNSGDMARSLEYSLQALATGREHNNEKAVAVAMNKLANVYQEQGNFESAKKYYDEALALMEKQGDKMNQATLLRNYARLYSTQKNNKKAEEYARRALALAQETGSFANIRDEAEVLCKILNTAGKPATEPCQLFSVMNDSIKNEEMRKKERFLAFKQEYEKYDAQLAAKDKEEKAEPQQKRSLNPILWSGIGIALILLAVAFERKRKRKRG